MDTDQTIAHRVSPGLTGNLRAVINKIHAAVNIDEILPDISRNICT